MPNVNLNTIPSPFLFAPLHNQVHIPTWQNINQDTPLSDGVSGTMSYEIETHSPTLVGEEQQGMDKHFFKTPDGTYGIPGTSLKGMLRGVLESVTHSRLTQINDTLLSFRDLRMPEYREILTETIKQNSFKTRTKSGWLKFEQGQWRLYQTRVYRIENSEVERAFKIKIRDREAEKIYQSVNGIKKVSFTGHPEEAHSHSDNKTLIYAKATNLNSGKDQGYLIFTGQVSSTKHMNFIFQEPNQKQEFANVNVIKNFLSIVQKEDSQDKSKIFDYLKSQNHPNGIPVFYLTNSSGHVTSMGLAQMYRITYDNKIGDLRPDSHKSNEAGLDFASLMLGEINDNQSRKGRVSIGLAKLSSPTQPKIVRTDKIVLGSPKPSFFPAYIDQITNTSKKFNTYNTQQAKLAGRKQYLIQKDFNSNITKAPTDKVASILHLVDKGHKFQGKIRFHNLSPIELGALIWAITLGEQTSSNFYHNIGMGKSYGFGKIKISLTKVDLQNTPENTTIDDLMAPFYLYALAHIESTLSLKQIRALHREQNEVLFYPIMAMGRDNQFNIIKDSAKTKMIKLRNLNIQPEEIWLNEIKQRYADDLKKQTVQANEQASRIANEKIKRKQMEEDAEKQRKKQLEEQQRLQNRTAYEQLFEDTLNKTIDKKTIQLLAEQPQLWQNLSPDEKIALAKKIKISQWFSDNKRKKLKDKFPSLLPLVDQVL